MLGSLLLAWNMADERSTGTSKREETRDAGSDISMAETDEDYDQFLLGLMDDISCNEAAIQPEKHRSVTKRPPTPGKQSVGTVEEHVDNEDVFSQWVSVPSSRKRSRSKRGPKEEEEEEEEGKGDSEEDEEAIGARGTGGGLRSTRQHTGPGTGVAQNRIGDISFNAGSGLRSEDRRTVQQLSVFTQTLSNALQLPVSELFATDEMDSEIMKFWDDDVAELRETQEEREETGSHEHVGREDGGEDPEYTILDQLAHRAQSRRDHDSGDGDRGREDARMARRSLGGASGGRTRTMYLQSGIRGAMEEAIVMLKSFIPQKYTSMQLASHKKRSVVVLYGKIVAKFIIKARQGNTTSRLDLLQEKRLRLDIKMLAEAIKQELK